MTRVAESITCVLVMIAQDGRVCVNCEGPPPLILVNLGASLPLGARGALGDALESRRLMVTRFVREFCVP